MNIGQLILAKKIEEVEEYIFKNRMVTVTELMDYFKLSESTVRRYVNLLEDNKKIKKKYGSISANLSDNLLNIRTRIDHLSEKKIVICEAAIEIINDGDILFFDSGTTHMHMATLLKERKNLTVVTNNLLFAIKIADLDYNLDLIFIPGYVKNSTISVSGDISLEFINQFYFDTVFLTTSGVTDSGFTNRTLPESTIKKKILDRSHQAVILADDSKFGKKWPFTFCNFSDIDYLFTNQKPDEKYLDIIKNSKIKIIW